MNPRHSSPVLSLLRVAGVCLLGAASGLVIHSLVRTSLPGTIVLLFAGGVFWGSVLRWPNSLIASLCVVGILPVITIAEMLRVPASHPGWPGELMIYGLMALLPVLGVFAGKAVKRALTAPTDGKEPPARQD